MGGQGQGLFRFIGGSEIIDKFRTEADVKEILATSLAYTPLDQAKAYLGKPGERGKLHDIFDTVMQLNLENGAAETKLDSNQQIDNAVINLVAGN